MVGPQRIPPIPPYGDQETRKKQQNPGETQDTTDARNTFHLQQNAMDIQEGSEGTGRGDGWVARALLLVLQTAVHTLHQPQEAGVESLEGEDANNPAAERPHGVKK